MKPGFTDCKASAMETAPNWLDRPSYTRAMALETRRYLSRTKPGLLTSSRVLSTFQGYVSRFLIFFYYIGIFVFFLAVAPVAFPYLEVKRRLSRRGREESGQNVDGSLTNVSNTRGSWTAIMTLRARGYMNRMGCGGPDHLAPLLMDNISFFGSALSRLFTDSMTIVEHFHFFVTGRLLGDEILPKTRFKMGLTAYMQARTCWLDDCVDSFLFDKGDGIEMPKASDAINKKDPVVNVVILGAGYDTRCYRLGLQSNGAKCFEVDARGTQQQKVALLKKVGFKDELSQTTFVSCDFASEDWLQRLIDEGFDAKLPTLFIWEGVTMYLPQFAVESTLSKVASLAPGSCIAFDYFSDKILSIRQAQKMSKKIGETLHFGTSSSGAEELVTKCGLETVDHLFSEELTQRYLAKRYDGSGIGYIGNVGGFLVAARK